MTDYFRRLTSQSPPKVCLSAYGTLLREPRRALHTHIAGTLESQFAEIAENVAKFMGDGVLIYFGYPQAHEDDAERAVRAGLELVAAVSDLKTREALQTRVGIATGLVVVGDLIGSGALQGSLGRSNARPRKS